MSVKVSVIVPVYQTEPYLKKCLNSLVNQTLQDIEILVINDGSKDNSQMIIDEYAKAYPQIKPFIKENGGLSDARNYGVALSKGDYIAFVDSDDYVEEHMMASMVEQAIQEHLDVVVCDTFMDYPNHSYVLKADLSYTEDTIASYIMCYPNAPARLIKRDIMEKLKFKQGTWYEDLQLMPTLPLYTDRIGFSHCALYHYVQREDSIMNQKAFKDKYYDIFAVMDDVYSAYQNAGLLPKYEKEIEYLFIIQLQRSAVLRFCDMKQNDAKTCLKRIENIMDSRFPNWKQNPYLKQSGWKFKLICFLSGMHWYRLIACLKHMN